MIEAVVVSSTLIALLALGMAIHEKQANRLSSSREARALAWSEALRGCNRQTDFRGILQRALEGGSRTSAERFVIDTPIATTSDSAEGPGGVSVPCNELPSDDNAGVPALDAFFDQHLLPNAR